MVLDPEKFVVRGNQIHVLGKEPLAPVNFAACWNSGGRDENYVDVAATVGAAHFLVPPIVFTETEDCFHLRFDFYRNTWMVQHQQVTVPVPRIRDIEELDFDPDDPHPFVDEATAYPWLAAVSPSTLQAPSDKDQASLWWADPSPVDEEIRDSIVYIAEDFEEWDDDEDDEHELDDEEGEEEGEDGP